MIQMRIIGHIIAITIWEIPIDNVNADRSVFRQMRHNHHVSIPELSHASKIARDSCRLEPVIVEGPGDEFIVAEIEVDFLPSAPTLRELFVVLDSPENLPNAGPIESEVVDHL